MHDPLGNRDLSVLIDIGIADRSVVSPDILVREEAAMDKGIAVDRVRLMVEVAGSTGGSDLRYKQGRHATAGAFE